MKMFFGCLAAILIAGCLSQASVAEIWYSPGIYEGSAQGHRGTIRVRVQISHAGIEDIVITSHMEGTFPGVAAMEELLDQILIEGTTDLDVITGATLSSRGLLDAVDDALSKAHQHSSALINP